ncbi:MAG: long-chain fatty acid--CoA ligase [Treponema sp.]|nr:long-chain fatty acid--CoA ligase [Treponema sp.]
MKKCTFNTNLPKNLPLLLKERTSSLGYYNLQAYKNKEGQFEYFTYNQVYQDVLIFALALKSLGVKSGDKIAMISDNRREWLITDMAIQSLGSADVPRGCDSMGSEIRFIINFADCKMGFFENEKQILKVLENIQEVPLLKTAIFYEEISEECKKNLDISNIEYHYFWDLMNQFYPIFQSDSQAYTAMIENEMNKVGDDSIATIIFTSGTTGTPKGVMLTQKNYMSQMSVVHNYMPGKPGDWWMTILPVWHSFERLAQYVAITFGMGLAYSKPIGKTLLADMITIKPHTMCGVPRLWESLVFGINKTMEKKGGITYKLYKFFISIGKKYSKAKALVTDSIFSGKRRNRLVDFAKGFLPLLGLFPLRLLGNLLVYNKIKEKFGGKFEFAVSGGGSLQEETDEFFQAIGLPMLNGYGMTETAPAIAFRDYKNPQTGCVGDIFPILEMKIVKEEGGKILDSKALKNGEKGLILVKGPNVMKGYYKRPDLTESIIDKDGWLNTGDIGIMSPKNEIKITGRAKDTIVLLDGENIEPVGLEQTLCSCEFIESAMVVGQDKKYLSSLIVPRKEAILNYAKEHSLIYASYEKLLESEVIQKLIFNKVDKLISVNSGFRTCEKIYKITLLSKSFEVGKELSAKQEMMRFKIAKEYENEITKMYA